MKKVAATLKEIQGSEIYNRIMDAGDALDDVIEEVKEWWRFDLLGRSPSRAIMNPDGSLMKPTDLDLACFLAALADRGAVINLPVYKSRRPKQLRDDEWVISAGNRHGKFHGLTSNKDVFSFSALLLDANVMKRTDKGDEIGGFRNFMVVDLDGHFYDGWRVIEFVPTRKENDFVTDKGLWTGNKIYFDRFVHPNRWVSFYGQPYVLTKVLIDRLKAEAKDLGRQIRAMESLAGAPGEEEDDDGGAPKTVVGPSKSEMVKSFVAEIDGTSVPESFPHWKGSSSSKEKRIEEAKERLKKLRFHDTPELQFAVRATELAFCQQARCFDSLGTAPDAPGPAPEPEPMPGWIRDACFDNQLVKRTTWRRLVLHQAVPFARGLAIRYRVRWKSERVAA